MSTASVLGEVMTERARQDELHGKDSAANPDLPLGLSELSLAALLYCMGRSRDGPEAAAKWACEAARERGQLSLGHILFEEVVEAFCAPDDESRRTELKQVAAVCVAAIEAIDARKKGSE